MLLHHGGFFGENAMPVGIWDTLEEDAKGLKSEGILADTQRGIEAYTLMKMKPRPAINGLSIGYIPKKVTLGTKEGEPRRRLHEVELIEISIVTRPMNGKARVTGVKSLGDLTEREVERWLMQDAGLSRSESRVVINQGFKSLKAMQDAGSSELVRLFEALKKRDVF
jgi:HK97 family phage prohead protease